MDERELTPEEKMAFQRLAREAEPSRILEERIVRSLREEGVLGHGAIRGSGAGGISGGGRWYRPWMAAVSVAASLVLFSSGVVLGQWMGSQSTTQAFMQVREQDATQLALRIQEAGSAYVSALAALSELRVAGLGEEGAGAGASQAGTDLQQGREVALGALYGAANELVRMSPGDADVLRVLQILEERRAREEGWGGEDRNVVWF
jgi:hypothetical protein